MRIRLSRSFHALSLGVCVAIFTGCTASGGGTPGVVAQQDPNNGQAATLTQTAKTSEGNVTFAIGITPKPKAPAARPRYVSPSTQSLKILTDGANPLIVNLTPASPGCSKNPAAPGSYVCKASLNVPSGNHTFTLTAYDQTGATGNVLSTNSSGVVFVKPSGTTTVSVVLQGVVQYVLLSLTNSQPATGTAAKIALTAVLQDADHNTIVGPALFENPVTLTSSDPADGPLSKSVLDSPADEAGLTVDYDGAKVASITYSASALAPPLASVTNAVLTPVTPTPTGSNALAIYTASTGATYAFVPNANGLSVVQISDGTTLAASKASRDRAAAESRATFTPIEIPLTPVPSACTTDAYHALLYCFSFFDPRVTVLDLSVLPSAPTVKAAYATDAGTGVNNSSGGCFICGAVYDSTDSAIVFATGNGYELYSSALAKTPNAHLKTIPANVSENFGYYAASDTIFSPEYNGYPYGTQSIDIVPLSAGSVFSLSPQPSGLANPDAGAVDDTTGIGVSTEEISVSSGANTAYLVNIKAPVLNSPSAGTYTAPEQTTTLTSSLFGFSNATQCAVPVTNIAVDSQSHLAFFSAEFCAQQASDPYQADNGSVTPVGVATLPSTSTGALQFGKSMFANLPPLPDGTLWDDALDPHVVATFHLPVVCPDCGAIFNLEDSWIAVINLTKLLAAPPSATDPNTVDPSYDLVGNGVVTYIPTGFTSDAATAAARPHLRRRR